MIYANFECKKEMCSRYASNDCIRCKNNVKRNCLIDSFEECKDNAVLGLERKNGRFITRLVGSAEQGGILCPACGYSNNAYLFNEETNYTCEKCGLPLTCKK